jgi:hypothetical protein
MQLSYELIFSAADYFSTSSWKSESFKLFDVDAIVVVLEGYLCAQVLFHLLLEERGFQVA